MALSDEILAIGKDNKRLWIYSKGLKENLPILIFNHGGPGSTLMPFSDFFDSYLLKYFTVVHWDQRGAGKSYQESIFSAPLSISQFVDDTKLIIEWVKTISANRPIYLIGHSWGSLVGIKFASQYPNLIDGYVGVGQLVDDKAGQRSGYEFSLYKSQQINDVISQNALQDLGHPPYKNFKDRITLSNLLMKFGGIFTQVGFDQLEKAITTQTVYTEQDLMNQERGMKDSIEILASQILDFDAVMDIKKIDTPVLFIQGAEDQATPSSLVEKLFHALDAPKGKKIIMMEESGHFPFWDRPQAFAEILHRELGSL